MQIPAERALWILDYYRRHGTLLYLAARLSGEEANLWITISHVSATLKSIELRLYDDDGRRSWDREIPLGNARYFLFQMGDPSFMPHAMAGYHSALQMEFLDGSMLCFSERIGIGQRALAS